MPSSQLERVHVSPSSTAFASPWIPITGRARILPNRFLWCPCNPKKCSSPHAVCLPRCFNLRCERSGTEQAFPFEVRTEIWSNALPLDSVTVVTAISCNIGKLSRIRRWPKLTNLLFFKRTGNAIAVGLTSRASMKCLGL